jgi:citrate lyase subunit beta / citryl-CoA lyase
LEDAVSLTEKDSARILVREAIKNIDYSGVEVIVRINPLSTKYGRIDLETIATAKPDVIMIPKADEFEVKTADETLILIEKQMGLSEGCIKLMPLIETAYCLENISSIIKSSNRVIGVLLGAEDLTLDMRIKRTKEGEEIFYARSKVAAVCRALKVDAIDTPFTDTDDYEGLEKDTLKAKSLGMTGKAAINPRQVETINNVFAPDEEDIKKALRIIKAMEIANKEGKGVFSLDGKMVDQPIISTAINTVGLAKRLGLLITQKEGE